ncbi:MAG: DUF4388 domain-containing protein [Deltaproteobacteria bacterium]|nr:DUF4388 domain-containing protein [Deltaproteobacteria bacterium]
MTASPNDPFRIGFDPNDAAEAVEVLVEETQAVVEVLVEESSELPIIESPVEVPSRPKVADLMDPLADPGASAPLIAIESPVELSLATPLEGATEAAPEISQDLNAAHSGDLLENQDEPLIIELMRDGRLRAPLEETRELLRDRMTRAEVHRTGPGWLLLRSVDPVAGPSSREQAEENREVVMAGTLGESALSMIDVLGFLAQSAQTGVLSVSTGTENRSIYLSEGDVVWASSTVPDDQLGEFLVRRGRITRDALAMVTKKGPRRIGRACVDLGLLKAHELWDMVQAQLTEIFDAALASDRGIWTFARVSPERLGASQVHMSTQGLLMDSVRKFDEMRMYREVVRSANVSVFCVDAHLPNLHDPRFERIEEDLRGPAYELVRRLDGEYTVRDLMRLMGKSEYEITRLVYHLRAARLVRLAAPESVPPGSFSFATVSKAKMKNVVTIYGMAIREIYDVFRGEKQHQLAEAARQFLSAPEHARRFSSIRISARGELDELAVLRGLDDEREIQEMSEALSELLFFLLFEAGELLPPRRRDDLARRVKMIHAMLASAEAQPTGDIKAR